MDSSRLRPATGLCSNNIYKRYFSSLSTRLEINSSREVFILYISSCSDISAKAFSGGGFYFISIFFILRSFNEGWMMDLIEDLILVQDERWRRGQGMQVERIYLGSNT